MVSLASNSSRDSLSPISPRNLSVPPSPSGSIASSGSSSSKASLQDMDDENMTITANHALSKFQVRKQKSQSEDLRLLAISTNMTEISYSISDIQTRIFEIQELRHQSQITNGDASGATNVIDQSLSSLDERLTAVADGIKAVTESIQPILENVKTPTVANGDAAESGEETALCRKHAALLADWENVQRESDMLREELREDKWLTVFRTVTEQADGMMASLEKAVNRCQDFIDKVQKKDDWMSRASSSNSSSVRSENNPLSVELFNQLYESFEAKKKHYMPATSKVLSILDKGVQDRVTKNGECLRRHAESTQRWNTLRARITRTEAEMEYVRKLLSGEYAPSEAGSSASGTHNGYLASPANDERAASRAGTISRSISPFRKFARKFKGGPKSPIGPITPMVPGTLSRMPSSEPNHKRKSIFGLRMNGPSSPATPPDRTGHKYSMSLTPDSPEARRVSDNGTVRRPVWNSSTKIEDEEKLRMGTVKMSPGRRPHQGPPPVQSNYKRSVSRSSMGSSRPWSPINSGSTAPSSVISGYRPPSRPSSRAAPQRAPSRTTSYGLQSMPTTPGSRPKTPSYIPEPASHYRSLSQLTPGSSDGRPFSPTLSVSASSDVSSPYRSETPGGTRIPHPRPPSRSMIPVPRLSLNSPSRPGSTMSNYGRPDSSMSFRSSAMRAQTPEGLLKKRVAQLPYIGDDARATPRPSLFRQLPPSSYKDSASPAPRSSSRAGAATPMEEGEPLYPYTPGNARDPLDAEFARVVNALPHGFVVERVDPPMRGQPRENEELRAQYAFSNQLGRKVVNCKLTTMARPGASGRTQKVMCRVGGGWQDLHVFVMNRQAATM